MALVNKRKSRIDYARTGMVSFRSSGQGLWTPHRWSAAFSCQLIATLNKVANTALVNGDAVMTSCQYSFLCFSWSVVMWLKFRRLVSNTELQRVVGPHRILAGNVISFLEPLRQPWWKNFVITDDKVCMRLQYAGDLYSSQVGSQHMHATNMFCGEMNFVTNYCTDDEEGKFTLDLLYHRF